MANHKSAKKRVRQAEKKRLHNRFYKKTTRSAIKRLRSLTEGEAAKEFMPKVVSMIDRLAKNHQIHKNKAANLKSKLAKRVASLSAPAQ
jgi:small subunit ribosomal protein S20